ncbi:ArgE/DapE family deacylase [Acetobacter sp. LMG 1627]|uniref:ArgE/DapE family deacylase n=2 Tax=Acetobacter conturbans TaxID=1737472 RepID=A0ABX0K5Y9_9PROT|nr:M20 family metallopeptidase [Acetobacter conturbans]NHN89778.1 ArgE/DapE family deacylase [Acetobacter conturbans]
MVALNTENPPGNEMALAPFIGEALRKTGMDVLIDEYALGRANVVAKFHNGASPVFALNTHIDTVPAGDGWTKDPFSLTQEGDTLFGRGTCDCKGSLASMLEAVRILMASPESWSGTLLAVFVGDEEVASAGARHYARDCGKIDYVIVGEPTSNTVFSAHKGSLRPVVEITGVTAHSGTPELGRNAIYDAAIVTGAVKKHHEDVIRSITHPLVGNASLCITRVSGGKADNVVPDRCELLLDRRLVPGECEESAKADIINLLSGLEQSHGIKARVTAYKPTTGGATQTDLNNAVVQASLTEAEACGVSKPGPYGFQGACDLVHFREAGASGVVIGPGDLSYAHKPDEFVTIPELTNAVKIYVGIVRRLMPSSNVQANT